MREIMENVTLEITAVAHGGAGLGFDGVGRPIFVPHTIPGERVLVRITNDKKRYAHAELVEVLAASPARVTPRCPHFGPCGGCHFQHATYAKQLEMKRETAQDQLARIGGLQDVDVPPTLPHPMPWQYGMELVLQPVEGGGLGLWSPRQERVMPIETCYIVRPSLAALAADVDLNLPELRQLSLRLGDDDAVMAALAVEGMEPPQIEVDFPISVTIVLPDQTAASLIGDNYTVQSVGGRDFRVSPGCYLQPSPAGAALLVDEVLALAELSPETVVLELYSGVGTLTAFLAEWVEGVAAVEMNPDAVADMAVNLADIDNVAVFEGTVETVTPSLAVEPDVVVADPPAGGLSQEAVAAVVGQRPSRLIYVSSDVATLSRDGKQLHRAGYRPVVVQPIDLRPQTYHVDTVSLWVPD